MNEILNQHNDLIDLPLRSFDANEIDILQAICYKCQNEGTNTIELPFDQIRQLARFRAKDTKRFVKALAQTNRKLMSINFKLDTDTKVVQFVLFPTFEIDIAKQLLSVEVHPKFAYLLNQLTGNYTSIELQQSSSLNSSYSKGIYKKLRRYKDIGVWQVSVEEFKDYLNVPVSFKQTHIDTRIINPAIEELSNFFFKLKCTKVYKKNSSGRGRPSVVGYKFTFKPIKNDTEQQPTVAQIARKTDWQKLGKYCPVCHREVWKKRMTNESGEYWLLGHPDFKTGGCSWTSNNFGDALEKIPIATTDAEEENENMVKLASITADFLKGRSIE